MQYSLDKIIKKRKKKSYKKKSYKKKSYKKKSYKKKSYKRHIYKKNSKINYKKNIKGGMFGKEGNSFFPPFTEFGQNISTSGINMYNNFQGKPEIPSSNPCDQPQFKIDTTPPSEPGSVNAYYKSAANSLSD